MESRDCTHGGGGGGGGGERRSPNTVVQCRLDTGHPISAWDTALPVWHTVMQTGPGLVHKILTRLPIESKIVVEWPVLESTALALVIKSLRKTRESALKNQAHVWLFGLYLWKALTAINLHLHASWYCSYWPNSLLTWPICLGLYAMCTSRPTRCPCSLYVAAGESLG